MTDTTIKKVEAATSPRGEMGQKYLVSGKRVSMRLWDLQPGSKIKHTTTGTDLLSRLQQRFVANSFNSLSIQEYGKQRLTLI